MKQHQSNLYLILVLVFVLCTACSSSKQEGSDGSEASVSSAQVSTPDESGFISLFDGSTTAGWRNFKETGISDLWVVEDGALKLAGKGGGDIVTQEQYENFIFEMEWKISPGGNSGLFFHVSEADSLKKPYHSGPEFQILDNDGHKDGKITTHRAGDNYDLHACSIETVKAVGEWNHIRLVVDNGRVEHWMNGTKVVEYQLGSPEWEALYQDSKFTKWPAYGRAGKGHIGLQDHGDLVWFRNMRIKVL